jgi:nascent polypeptide-associated complex subunit alpha
MHHHDAAQLHKHFQVSTMMPGMNPRQMQQMMKQMGIQQVDVPATQVIIITPEKRIIIDQPQVAKVNAMGQQTWQIMGKSREEALSSIPDINEDDIQTVMQQAGVKRSEAFAAIKDANGDLAEAIIKLKGD